MKARDYQALLEVLKSSSVGQEESWVEHSDPGLNSATQTLRT